LFVLCAFVVPNTAKFDKSEFKVLLPLTATILPILGNNLYYILNITN